MIEKVVFVILSFFILFRVFIVKNKYIYSKEFQDQLVQSQSISKAQVIMPQLQRQNLLKMLRNIRILILLLPLTTIIQSLQKLIIDSSNFIVIITVMVLTYLGHEFHFKFSEKKEDNCKFLILQETRKIIVCFLCAYLTAFLIAEIYHITVNVYQVGYGDEIIFWFRVIVTLSNMEANIELCDKRHRNYKRIPS